MAVPEEVPWVMLLQLCSLGDHIYFQYQIHLTSDDCCSEPHMILGGNSFSLLGPLGSLFHLCALWLVTHTCGLRDLLLDTGETEVPGSPSLPVGQPTASDWRQRTKPISSASSRCNSCHCTLRGQAEAGTLANSCTQDRPTPSPD